MWHEARRSERKVHEMMDAAKRRAEKRAEFLASRRGDPSQSLRLGGKKCKLRADVAVYEATESLQALVPWNNKEDNLIDRFDGRAMLDFVREYNPRLRPPREKSEEEEELEQKVNFERYRDLIKFRLLGYNDKQGLAAAEKAIEVRAKHQASKAFDLNRSSRAAEQGPRSAPSAPAGTGAYAHVAFAYEGTASPALSSAMRAGGGEEGEEQEEDEGEEGEEEEEEEEDAEGGPVRHAEEERDVQEYADLCVRRDESSLGSAAAEYGVEDFEALVDDDRRMREEERRQRALAPSSGKRISRKERRKLARQGKDTAGHMGFGASVRAEQHVRELDSSREPHNPYRDRRGSPSYEDFDRHRPHSRSLARRSRRDDASREQDAGSRGQAEDAQGGSKIEFITEFGSLGSASGADADAAALSTYGPPPSPPRARPSERGTPRAEGQILEALKSDPAAVGASRVLAAVQAASRPSGFPRSSGSAGLSAASAASAKARGAASGAAGGGGGAEKKETPQERLKRLMSQQLSKQIKKDSAVEIARKHEAERTRLEKLEETRRAARAWQYRYERSPSRSPSPRRSRSPRRGRSRSRSPRRSRSRSRTPIRVGWGQGGGYQCLPLRTGISSYVLRSLPHGRRERKRFFQCSCRSYPFFPGPLTPFNGMHAYDVGPTFCRAVPCLACHS